MTRKKRNPQGNLSGPNQGNFNRPNRQGNLNRPSPPTNPNPSINPNPPVPAPVNRVVPRRGRNQHGRLLVIDPCGRAYFINVELGVFHWYTQLGNDTYVAEHEKTGNYIDFGDEDDSSLYHYSEDAQPQKLLFEIGKLKINQNFDLQGLSTEVSKFYSKGDFKLTPSKRECFLVDFENGDILGSAETQNHLDYMCVTRLDIELKHQLWCLRFAIFEAHAPCDCGLRDHGLVDHEADRAHPRVSCSIQTVKDYAKLRKFTGGITLPLIDFVVFRANRGYVKTHRGLYQGIYKVTAEENVNAADSEAYKNLERLDLHANILPFHGKSVFQNREYLVFGWYDCSLLDMISKGGLVKNPNVLKWAKGIAEGLLWLQEHNLYHGNVHPQNIVITDNKALLHGLLKDGYKHGDQQAYGALLYHLFTDGKYMANLPYIPSDEVLHQHLAELDPEGYDLVYGLIHNKINFLDVLIHPKFWRPLKKLDFIRIISDELTDNGYNSMFDAPLRQSHVIESIFSRFEDPNFRGLSRRFIEKAEEYGKLDLYGQRIVAAVIRSFRNEYNHMKTANSKQEGSKEFKANAYHLVTLIRSVYPNLIMCMFNNLKGLFWKRPDIQELLASS